MPVVGRRERWKTVCPRGAWRGRPAPQLHRQAPFVRLIALLVLALTVSGCSQLLSLALYNNTAATIQVCNLHRRGNACQVIPPRSIAGVLLVADERSASWQFRISSGDSARNYELGAAASLWELRSGHCMGISQKPCVAVQLQPNGLLYWVDSANSVRSGSMPPQPQGFPIAPGA